MEQERTGSVRGDLLRWARTQQELTMRWVHEHGGPCLGYQSEVERNKKAEVRYDVLSAWIRALNVTEEFARGAVPRHTENPAAAAGQAGHVRVMITSAKIAGPNWQEMAPAERVRQVLHLTLRHSPRFPRVVLAWALGLEVATLEGTLDGTYPVVKGLMEATSALTTLPVEFFAHGTLESDYQPVLERARSLGVTPQDLLRLLEQLDAGRRETAG